MLGGMLRATSLARPYEYFVESGYVVAVEYFLWDPGWASPPRSLG